MHSLRLLLDILPILLVELGAVPRARRLTPVVPLASR